MASQALHNANSVKERVGKKIAQVQTPNAKVAQFCFGPAAAERMWAFMSQLGRGTIEKVQMSVKTGSLQDKNVVQPRRRIQTHFSV